MLWQVICDAAGQEPTQTLASNAQPEEVHLSGAGSTEALHCAQTTGASHCNPQHLVSWIFIDCQLTSNRDAMLDLTEPHLCCLAGFSKFGKCVYV